MKTRDEIEQSILKRVAVSLWGILSLIIVVTLFIKDSALGIKEAVITATSIITQVYILNAPYGALIFIFALIGKILIIYIIYVIILLFSEGLFKQSLTEGRIMKRISGLKDHYIVCGGGRVGGNVAEDLKKAKKPFVVIDVNTEAINEFKENKILAIHGSSLDDGSLKKARIDKAKVLISCLDSDGDNILQIIVAKKLNKGLKIVSRASHEKFISNLKHAGAHDIIIPEIIGGQKIAQAALKFK